MPDALAQIQQEQLDTENSALGAARSNANWANTFASVPDEERLRANTTLHTLVNQAVERRAALAAQSDEKAQQLYYNAQKFDQWKQDAPNRAALLQAQIEHENLANKNETAKAQLELDNRSRALKIENDSAMAHWELNQATDPTADTDPDVQRKWVNSIAEKYPLAMQHDPGFRERYNAVQSGFTAQDKAAASEPGTEGLFDSPEDIWKLHPGATVSQSQVRKGKYYATNIPDPNKPPHVGVEKPHYEEDINKQIAAGGGRPFYYDKDTGKPKASDADHPPTHYEIEFQKDDGTFGRTPVSVERYRQIKNAARAQKSAQAAAANTPSVFTSEAEVEAAAKAGTVKPGQTVVVGGRKAVWH